MLTSGEPPATVPVTTGFVIRDYEVRAPIASGAWGSVYAGRRRCYEDAIARTSPSGQTIVPSPDQVALKFLPTGTSTPRFTRLLADTLRREVQSRQELRHRALVELYDVLTVESRDQPHLDGATVLVMELAAGSLTDAIGRHTGPWPHPDTTRCLRTIAEALAYMHETGWVHGDLKPSNVLVRPDGSYCLTDFGMAALLDGTHAYAPPLSTPDYAPPERREAVASGDGLQIRSSADVWAFGVIGWRMFTGLMPFPGETPSERATAAAQYAQGGRVLTRPPALIQSSNSAWAALLSQCLAADHQDRPTAREIVDRIDSIESAPSGPRSRSLLRRHTLLAGGLVLALSGWGVMHLITEPGPRTASRSTAGAPTPAPAVGQCHRDPATVTDPNSGGTFARFYCTNRPSAIYQEADSEVRVAVLKSTESWFVCYRRGQPDSSGTGVWYYTQGDAWVAGYRYRHSWGFVPASAVVSARHPVPEMPTCPPSV